MIKGLRKNPDKTVRKFITTMYRIGEPEDWNEKFFVATEGSIDGWIRYLVSTVENQWDLLDEKVYKLTVSKFYLPFTNISVKSVGELQKRYDRGEISDEDIRGVYPEETGLQHLEQYEVIPEDIVSKHELSRKEIESFAEGKKSRKNPATKSIVKQAEELLYEKYGGTKLRDVYNAAWIAPSGKLLGNLADHYDSAYEVLKDLGIYADEEEKDLFNFLRLGFIRFNLTGIELDIEIRSKITQKQFKKIEEIVRYDKIYGEFYFDITMPELELFIDGKGYENFLKVIDKYNLVKASRKNPIVKTSISFKTFQRLNPKKELIERAVDYFGITESGRAAGFILDDGRLLDFSGYKQGFGVRTKRHFVHDRITIVMETKDKMISNNVKLAFFQWQTGALRLLLDVYASDLAISIEFPQEITGYQILRVRNLVRAYGINLVLDVFSRDLQPGEQMLLYKILEDPTDKEINELFQKYFEYKKDIMGD